MLVSATIPIRAPDNPHPSPSRPRVKSADRYTPVTGKRDSGFKERAAQEALQRFRQYGSGRRYFKNTRRDVVRYRANQEHRRRRSVMKLRTGR